MAFLSKSRLADLVDISEMDFYNIELAEILNLYITLKFCLSVSLGLNFSSNLVICVYM